MLRNASRGSLVELVEVRQMGNSYRLVEFYVNPKYIVSVYDHEPTRNLTESMSQLGLSEKADFSTVIIKESHRSKEIQVVGCARTIYLKLNSRRGLLKG